VRGLQVGKKVKRLQKEKIERRISYNRESGLIGLVLSVTNYYVTILRLAVSTLTIISCHIITSYNYFLRRTSRQVACCVLGLSLVLNGIASTFEWLRQVGAAAA